MTAQELIRRTEEAAALSRLWQTTIGPPPELAQFHLYLKSFGFDITLAAVERTARKFVRMPADAEYQRKYCTRVATNLKAEGQRV